ncbi:hypothetical protein [Saccharothrix xinjiangensis]|uniref:Uncharacterized protein n=1 Tax=Saccharothrix xinjiangensis TaxID=204798 RepID=A0ABV9Y6S3_9PSEU
MTEPVPERALADAAAGTPPAAGGLAAEQRAAEQPSAPPEPEPAGPPPGTTGAQQAAPVEQPPAGAPDQAAPADPAGTDPAGGAGEQAAGNPQDLFGTLSLASIEADIDRLMTEKMSELDGMLAGLEELVQRLEGEITQLEPPSDDTTTP